MLNVKSFLRDILVPSRNCGVSPMSFYCLSTTVFQNHIFRTHKNRHVFPFTSAIASLIIPLRDELLCSCRLSIRGTRSSFMAKVSGAVLFSGVLDDFIFDKV